MSQKYTHRDRKLLDLAHKLDMCQINLPGICIGYMPDGCEPAHSNQSIHGKGMHHKAHDIYHAAACRECHQEIDQGRKLSREEKAEYWQRGFEKTMLEYWKRGWVVVK